MTLTLADQLLASMGLVVLVGVPHGAIDNVIFLKQHKVSSFSFYSFYLSAVAINVMLWIYFPVLAAAFFLLISAYHFGQSQFSHYQFESRLNYTLYFSWGASILSGMLLFNQADLKELLAQAEGFETLSYLLSENVIASITLGSTLIALGILIFKTIKLQLELEKLFFEVIILGLLLLAFYLFPLLIGFTLYFVILHSLKVLEEEFQFVQKLYKKPVDLFAFGKLLFPFTFFAVLGMVFIFALTYFDYLPNFSFGFLLLILISSITLPHAVVMERFYRLDQKPTGI